MRYRYRNEEEMKDSGIEWLGNIPNEWDIRQLKRVLIDRKENNNPIKTQNILSLTMEKGVIPYAEKGIGGNKAKEDLSLYKLVYPDDIVLNSMNVVVGSVGLSKYFGCASPAYYMLYKRNKNDIIEYFNNIFQSKLFQDSLIGLGNGILVKKSETSGKLNTIRMRIPMEKLNLVKIPVPHSREQEKIAKFVDGKTAQFNSIISKKQALIQRLEEAKQSLISEVVTGKVKVVKTSNGYELVERKKEEMKDSGVEWLGDIPKEWEVTKLKYNLCKIGSGKTPKGGVEVYSDSGVVFIRSQNVYDDGLRLDDVVFINEEINKEMNNSIVKFNDVLLNITGGSIGRSSLVSDIDLRANVNQHVCILRPIISEINPKLLHVIIQSNLIQLQIQALQNGSNREGLNFDQIANMVIVKNKNILEQELIVEYIKNVIDKIYMIINKTKKQIKVLKEAKQSLISEAVTGKIEILD